MIDEVPGKRKYLREKQNKKGKYFQNSKVSQSSEKGFDVSEDNPVANTGGLLESPLGPGIYIVILKEKATNHIYLAVDTIALK